MKKLWALVLVGLIICSLFGVVLYLPPVVADDTQTTNLTGDFTIDTYEEWVDCADSTTSVSYWNSSFSNGLLNCTANDSFYETVWLKYSSIVSPENLTINQSTLWLNWSKVPHLFPNTAYGNAGSFLAIADGEYYYLNEGLDDGDAYDVYKSSDMSSWTKYDDLIPAGDGGPWISTAVHNYSSGVTYIYFDNPNDGDSWLYTTTNITNWASYTKHGEVFDTPTAGSDAGAWIDRDGVMHLFSENFSSPSDPTHCGTDGLFGDHVWCSDGKNGFASNWSSCLYEIDRRYQGYVVGFGDYELIQVGDIFYIFSDYCCHTSSSPRLKGYAILRAHSVYDNFVVINQSINTEYDQAPDPTVGYCEEQFWCMPEHIGDADEYDRVSYGPWCDHVYARVGVDTDNDEVVDNWTNWERLREVYERDWGYTRIVNVTPATLDLSGLPDGYNFKIQINMSMYNSDAPPMLNAITLNVSGGDDPKTDIAFQSINSQANNTVVYTGSRTFNWTKVNDTLYYQLQVANDSGFTDVFINLSDVNETTYGVRYDEKGNYVEFMLPVADEIIWANSHYYRVRAYALS